MSTINDHGYHIILPKCDYDKSCPLANNFSRFGIAVGILPREYLGASKNDNSSDNINENTIAINDSNLSLTIYVNVARSVIFELLSFLVNGIGNILLWIIIKKKSW